jgi:hypothetical protein
LILTLKTGWATFWATFLQDHLVALLTKQSRSIIAESSVTRLGEFLPNIFCPSVVYFEQLLLENYRSSPLFINGKGYAFNLTKYVRMGWATFWAIFSQTHLVTLSETLIMVAVVSTTYICR